MALSPPLRFRHRILLSAASWQGSKYSLYALLCAIVSSYSFHLVASLVGIVPYLSNRDAFGPDHSSALDEVEFGFSLMIVLEKRKEVIWIYS